MNTKTTIADLGMFIPDTNFFKPRSKVKKIPDPGSASKNLRMFNPKKIVSRLSEI